MASRSRNGSESAVIRRPYLASFGSMRQVQARLSSDTARLPIAQPRRSRELLATRPDAQRFLGGFRARRRDGGWKRRGRGKAPNALIASEGARVPAATQAGSRRYGSGSLSAHAATRMPGGPAAARCRFARRTGIRAGVERAGVGCFDPSARGAAGRTSAARVALSRERRALLTASWNVPTAVPAISSTIRDAAETTPRAPVVVAVRTSAPMLAAPDTLLRSTSRASCSAPTATTSSPLTAPTSTRGITLASIPPTSPPVRAVLTSPALFRPDRVRVRALGLAIARPPSLTS
jgi:hypothetical protein